MELKNLNAVTFRDGQAIFLYDRYSNCFFEITSTIETIIDDSLIHTFEYIKQKYINIQKDELELAYNEIKEVVSTNLLKKVDIKQLALSNTKNVKVIVSEELHTNLSHLILCITEACNLRCKYCVYSGAYPNVVRVHGKTELSLEDAKKAIDFFMRNSKVSFEKRTIGFYGGEPLICFSLLKEIVNYIHTNYGPVKFILNTNFILVNEEIIKFLVKNNFELLISLDGPRDIHDTFRVTIANKGTYKIIEQNLWKIKNYNKNYFVHNVFFNVMINPVVSIADKLDQYFNTSLFEGMGPESFRVLMLNIEDNTFIDKFEYWKYFSQFYNDSLSKFINAHLHNQDKSFSTLKISYAYYKRGIAMLHLRNMNRLDEYDFYWPNGICIPGTRSVFVAPNGKYYPCEKLYDHHSMEIGTITDGIEEKEVIQIIEEYIQNNTNMCSSCWAFRLCSSCFYSCREKEKSYSYNKRKKYCVNTKNYLITIFKVYLQILKMNPKAFDYLIDENKKISETD